MKSDNKKIKLILGAAAVLATSAQSAYGLENEYPTQARVEYVLQCMDRMGGQSYNSLYPCICAVDKIADQINFDEFSEGQLYTYMRDTPGETGGLFRETDQAEGTRDKFKDAEEKAFKACLIKK